MKLHCLLCLQQRVTTKYLNVGGLTLAIDPSLVRFCRIFEYITRSVTRLHCVTESWKSFSFETGIR